MYKLIIFDVDGTFYNLDDVVAHNYQMQLDYYALKTGLSQEQVEEIFARNRILPYKSEEARSATEFFVRDGLDSAEWAEYRNSHSSPENINRDTAVDNSLLMSFAECATLVLLSSNTRANLDGILGWLEIDEALFDRIVCSTEPLGDGRFCKLDMVKEIVALYGLDAADVLAIGDRYKTDVEPLEKLGGDGVLVHIPDDLNQVYRDLTQGILGANEDAPYRFYGKRMGERKQ